MDTVAMRLVARLLLAPSWMVALAVLLKGHAETGDGFSAALIAGAGILIQYLVRGGAEARRLPPVRRAQAICGAGLLLVLGTALLPVFFGKPPLTHFPAPGSEAPRFGSLELHSGLALDAGIFLLVLGFLLAVFDALAGARQEPRLERRSG